MFKNDTTPLFFDPSKNVSESKYYTHFSMTEWEQCNVLNKWFEAMSNEFYLKDNPDNDKHKFIFEKVWNIQVVILFMLEFM